MKTAINKRKLIAMVLMSIFTTGFSQMAFSNGVPKTPIELKSIGKLSNPLFELKMNNAETGEFLVRVKNGYGDLLYSGTLKGKNVSQRYQLDINEDELNDVFTVQFEITIVKTHETFIYNVTRNSRVIEDMIVAKL